MLVYRTPKTGRRYLPPSSAETVTGGQSLAISVLESVANYERRFGLIGEVVTYDDQLERTLFKTTFADGHIHL